MKQLEIVCIFGVLIAACAMHQANQSSTKESQSQAQQGSKWLQKQLSNTANFDFKNSKSPLANFDGDIHAMQVPRRDMGLELDAMKARANSR